jgi:hypothetical protein
MRPISFALLATGGTLLAAGTVPTLEKSDAILTGKVRAAEKIKVMEVGGEKSELWRADVEVDSIIKGDAKLAPRVFIYYSQDWQTNYGRVFEVSIQACPARPKIATNTRYKFFCVRTEIGGEKLLYLPEARWATKP